MTSLDVMATDARVSRARFWRRVFAFSIDGFAIGAVLAGLGLLLFPLTDGWIRVASVPVNVRTCTALRSLPPEFRLPADFKPTYAVRCTWTVLGHVYNREVLVGEVTRSGRFTYERKVTYAVDVDGLPQRAFYLDYLWVFLLAAYLLITEWRFGTTLGKDLLDMHVQSLDGGPLTFSQAAKRLVVRFFPALILMPWFVTHFGLDATQIFSSMTSLLVFVAIAAIVGLTLLINFIIAVRRGNLPWHDRWAGSEVVRGR